MYAAIIDFVKALCDNEYESKFRGIPDEFDQTDELLAEIELAGEIPPSMFDLELNGFSNPIEFEDFFEKNFNSFKIYFLSTSTNKNIDLVAEVHDQILDSKAVLLQIKQSLISSSDITFKSLIDLKISYCEKTISFIETKCRMLKEQLQNNGASILTNIVEKKNSNKQTLGEDPPVYVFRIKKEITNWDHVIKTLHKELKKYRYIDCSLPQFRKLFIGDTLPQQSPEPIKWKHKTYYHFSYFIRCLHRSLISYSKKPSNNVIARKLFLSLDGVPFTEKGDRFDSRSDKTQEVRAFFDKIIKNCDPKYTTTSKKKPTS